MKGTLLLALLIPLIASSTQAHRGDELRSFRLGREKIIGAAFVPSSAQSLSSSSGTLSIHQRDVQRSHHAIRTQTELSFGRVRQTLSHTFINQSKLSPSHTRSQRQFLPSLSLAASGDDDVQDDGEQKGMEEAFASLEQLSSEDLIDDATGGDKIASSNLKYSRTDDTPAADMGKSTEEEVEHYLEMQGELEGTASSQDSSDEDKDVLELSIDEILMDEADENDDEDLADENGENEFPWESINPILRVRGPVASGYGRGGKQLGVPTANLPSSLFQSALEDVTNGVYFGWAVIEQSTSSSNDDDSPIPKGRNTPIKAVVNVGYSPTFEGKENKEKIVEAHLITESSPMNKEDRAAAEAESEESSEATIAAATEIEGDFYNETMRLQLIGYLRPEQKFDSFPDLIAQIHRDIGNADWALDEMPYVFSKEDEFVKDGGLEKGWVGVGGGDDVASWEFESW